MRSLPETASASSVVPFVPPDHQREVDARLAAIRGETGAPRPSLFKPAPPKPEPSTNVLDHRIAEELEYMARQLEHLGGILAGDPILLIRHAGPLQSIDLMKQTLGHLARVIAAQDKERMVDRLSLTALKAKLQRKPLRPLGGEGSPG